MFCRPRTHLRSTMSRDQCSAIARAAALAFTRVPASLLCSSCLQSAREFLVQLSGDESSSGAAAAADCNASKQTSSLWEDMVRREKTGGAPASALDQTVSGWGAGASWADAFTDLLSEWSGQESLK